MFASQPPLPCLVLRIEEGPGATALAAYWAGALEALPGAELQMVFVTAGAGARLDPSPALEAWQARVGAAPCQPGVLVVVGPAALPPKAGEVVAALRAEGHPILAVAVPSHAASPELDREVRVQAQLRTRQFDPTESGRTALRYTLKSEGNEGYLLVTVDNFEPKESKFEASRENWVWPEGVTPWKKSFTLEKTTKTTYKADTDVPVVHPHGRLVAVEGHKPKKGAGDAVFVHKNGDDRIVIFKADRRPPRYYATTGLVNEEHGHFTPSSFSFERMDDATFSKGKWYRFPR